MRKIKTSDKQVFVENINMETQTVFKVNGEILIYPCDFERGQQIVRGGTLLYQRGRMVTNDDGSSHFHPYREGSGNRYRELLATASGGLLATKKHIIPHLKLKKSLTKSVLLEQFDYEVEQIREYINSLNENIMWD